MSMSERQDIIEQFNDDDNSMILVETTRILGAGLTCTRSFRCILLEPDYKQSIEDQAFARVWRMRQANAAAFAYRLYTENLEMDSLFMNKQIMRSAFVKGAFAFREQRAKVHEEQMIEI